MRSIGRSEAVIGRAGPLPAAVEGSNGEPLEEQGFMLTYVIMQFSSSKNKSTLSNNMHI